MKLADMTAHACNGDLLRQEDAGLSQFKIFLDSWLSREIGLLFLFINFVNL